MFQQPVISSEFPSNYACEVVEHPPALEPIVYLPDDLVTGRDGVLLRITPRVGAAWLGCFAFGQFMAEGLTGVYALPDPDVLCVVSNGDGFIGVAANALSFRRLPLSPVRNVLVVPDRHRAVFVGATWALAYGPSGVVWRTGELSDDLLQDLKVDGDFIVGSGWSAAADRLTRFAVNVTDGSVLWEE